MTESASIITRINAALLHSVDQLTSDALRDARDYIARMTCADPYVEANRNALLERSNTGRAKYGTDLTRDDLTDDQWTQHAIEELLDAANYLQRMRACQRQHCPQCKTGAHA